jgi:hypothetical protein
VSIVTFAERQARRLYTWRLLIALGGTGAALTILLLPGLLRRAGVMAYGSVHVIRFAVPILLWGWCVFFLCEWFHPRRGVFASPRRHQGESDPEDASGARSLFLGILLLGFCSPVVLWLVLLF